MLVERVQNRCVAAGVKEDPDIVREDVEAALESHMEEWLGIDEAEWPEWLEAKHPELRDEFLYDKRMERLGWYFENTPGGMVEDTALKSILKRPRDEPEEDEG